MRDDRKIFINEENGRANDGWGKLFGLLFVSIMAFAFADRALTLVWMALKSWIG